MMAPTYRNSNIFSCSNLKLAYPSNKNHAIITLERNKVDFWGNLAKPQFYVNLPHYFQSLRYPRSRRLGLGGSLTLKPVKVLTPFGREMLANSRILG
jgi:hypothetical protein